MVKLKGKYRGVSYEIDELGYTYELKKPNGDRFIFQPDTNNKIFDHSTSNGRIKELRKQIYNNINRCHYKCKNN